MEGMTTDDPTVITVGDGSGSTLLNESYLDVVMQLPLPGIVIFVHGVNSDGEWYQAAEEGLCRGLNTRIARNEGQIQYCTVEGGKAVSLVDPYSPRRPKRSKAVRPVPTDIAALDELLRQ